MATLVISRRPVAAFKPVFRSANHDSHPTRALTTSSQRRGILNLEEVPARLGGDITTIKKKLFTKQFPLRFRPSAQKATTRKPTVYPSPFSTRHHCREPLLTVASTQISLLDPSGARTRLFSRDNPEAAKVGDILLVRQKNGDPFAGVCLNIRRRGVESAILLRNQITRVGVEMWYKIYSPNVVGIEVVQRRVKRARRARLYYMRKPEHDMGSVQNIVTQYIRQRQVLRSGGDSKGRDANAGRREKAKKKK